MSPGGPVIELRPSAALPIAASADRFVERSAQSTPVNGSATLEDNAQRPSAPVLEYTGLPGGWRYDSWREGVCRSFCRIDAEPGAANEIHWKVEIPQVSSLSLATVGGTSGLFRRTRDLLSDSCDDFVLTTAISGDVLVTQGSDSIVLQQSQMCLMDMSVEGGVGLLDGNQFTSTRIPRRDLLSVCPRAEGRLSEPLLESVHIRELIVRYFTLSAEAAASVDVVGQQVMARHMIDLIALLLHTGQDETQLAMQRGYSAARLQLIQAKVLESLGDNSLTIGSIAQRSALAPKQVQRLFERAGTTFTEFVLEHRLLLARRLLCRPCARQDKVSTIAYAAGFGDLSYFNRTFRRRFGISPSEWRDGQPAYS
jgi:AraC-like DNA-binding protein